MFLGCLSKDLVFKTIIMSIFIFFSYMLITIPLSAQILTYPFLNQGYLPLLTNPLARTYNLNPYFGINTSLSLYNTIQLLQNTALFNKSITLPQASIAGGLIPFTNPFAASINPIAYSLASTFSPFTPFTPVNYLYNAGLAGYLAATAIPANVAGSWTGIWVSTFLAGGVTTGDLSITLAQVDTEVTGTVVFLLNKVLKFGAEVVGTVTGNTLLLTSTVVPSIGGTKSFDVTLTAVVTDLTMDGTYEVINNVTGNIAEEGTFTATRL